VMAFAGVATFQTPAVCQISSGATLQLGPVTTTTPSLLLTFISRATQSPTVAGGFTISDYQPYGSFEGISTAYQVQSASGTASPIWTNNAGQNYSGFLVLFAGASNQPTITSVNPTNGVVGATVPVTLNGTNFLSGSTVNAGANISVSNVNVVSSTQITANFAIAANAPPGAANIMVTNTNGTSAPAIFTINPAAPTLTAINPNAGQVGAAVPVTLTGSNFISGATINAGAGVKMPMNDKLAMRTDARWIQSFGRQGTEQFRVSQGISFDMGKR